MWSGVLGQRNEGGVHEVLAVIFIPLKSVKR